MHKNQIFDMMDLNKKKKGKISQTQLKNVTLKKMIKKELKICTRNEIPDGKWTARGLNISRVSIVSLCAFALKKATFWRYR